MVTKAYREGPTHLTQSAFNLFTQYHSAPDSRSIKEAASKAGISYSLATAISDGRVIRPATADGDLISSLTY
jgi:hypothetical protein